MSDNHALESDFPEEPTTTVSQLLSELKLTIARASKSLDSAERAAQGAVQEAKRRSSNPPPPLVELHKLKKR
jgi:hypothetical protein